MQGNFLDIDKLILKFTWTDNRPRVANTILKNILKTYYLISRFIINYSNQDCVVLVEQYIHRTMEQKTT